MRRDGAVFGVDDLSQPAAIGLQSLQHRETATAGEPLAVRFISLALLAAPIAWLAGLFIFWFHILALVAALLAVSASPATRPRGNTLALLALIYAGSCVLSILVNAPGDEVNRVISGFYLASYWVMGAATCYVAAQQDLSRARARLLFAAHAVSLTTLAVIAVCLVAWFWFGVRRYDLASPAAQLLGRLASLTFFSEHVVLPVLSSDWFAGSLRPRVTTFAQYPVPTAMLMAMLLPFLWVYRREACRRSTLLWLLALVGVAAGMWLANSRTTFVGGFVAFSVAYLVYRRRLVQVAIVALPILLILTPVLAILLDDVAASRAASTQDRLSLYAYGLNKVLSTSPLFGLGLPRRVGIWEVPVGSHSTVLGALYRNGLVGLLLLSALVITVTAYWFRAMRRTADANIRLFLAALGGPILFMDIAIFTEDLDWPQFVCFLYFFLQGTMIAAMRADRAGRSMAAQKAASPLPTIAGLR